MNVVSFASPLAVIVVGKNTVVPLAFLVGESPGPGDMIKGDILPIFVSSSMKLVPFPNGEFTMADEVGREPPMIACGEGGGSVGVLGSVPGIPAGGARVNGEYTLV